MNTYFMYNTDLDRSVGVVGSFPTPPPVILVVDNSMHSDNILRNESQDLVI